MDDFQKQIQEIQNELKECPFCGERPNRSDILLPFGIKTIACENKYCYVKPYAIGHTIEEAIEKWNMRKEVNNAK